MGLSSDFIGSAQWLTSNIGFYGRQDELETLNEAYERTVFKKNKNEDHGNRPVPELVLLHGLPGVGKTHLVKHSFLITAEQHAKSNNKQQGGVDNDVFFITGKFEKLRSQHPYSAIHEAFTMLTRQLLEHDRDVINFIIDDVMRGNQPILTDLFPMLQAVIGHEAYFQLKPPRETTTGAAEVQNRFYFAFRNFLKTVCNYKPIVLFIEDLQWSDLDSLHLLKGFLEDRSIKQFLLIGSYQSNEVGPGHQLNLFNNDLKELNIRISSIEITVLSSANIQEMVLETFPTNSDDDNMNSRVLVEKLSEIVNESTKGNCFHVFRLLQYFLSEKLLTHNSDTKTWNYDLPGIQARDLPSSVEDLIVLEIHKQPKSVIQLLKIGAALGTYFDDYTVNLILRSGVDTLTEDDWGKDDVVPSQQDREITDDSSASAGSFMSSSTGDHSSTLRDAFACAAFKSLSAFRPALGTAVNGGFLEQNKLGYKFSHDKVRLAAYEMIEESSRGQYHLEIGRLMVRNASPARQKRRQSSRKVSFGAFSEEDMSNFVERQLFVAVDQLNRGKEFITESAELENLISLNLRAAEKAYFSASFLSSKAHIDAGSDILYRLSNEPWQSDDHYDLCLKLHTKQADVELALGNHEAGMQHVQSVLDNARSRSEKIQVQYALIRSLSRQEKFRESAILSRSVLKELGVYPKRFTTIQATRGYLAVKGLLKKYSDDNVFKFPTIVDKEKLFAMEVLRHLSNNAFMSQRMMDFLLSVVTRIRMSFDDGRCDETAYAFATHAVSLVMFGDQDGAVRCANLASKLLETNKGGHLDGLVLFVVHRFVDSWNYPAEDIMRGYRRGYVASMDCGDVEAGFVNWYQSIWHAFDSGSKLRPLLQSLVENMEQADLYRCNNIVHPARFVIKSFKQLCGIEPLDWNEMDEFQPGNDFEVQTLVWIYLAWLLEAVFFRRHSLAEGLAKKLSKVADHDASYNVLNLRLFYTGLFASARAHETGKSQYVKKLQNCEKQLEDLVNNKGRNCIHRHLLLKAECMAVKSKDLAMTRKSFDNSISAAKEVKCIPDVALANEVAGEYMLKKQDYSSAGTYLTEAWAYYLLWGAESKVIEMEDMYEALIDKAQRESVNAGLLNLEFISSDTSSPDQNHLHSPQSKSLPQKQCK